MSATVRTQVDSVLPVLYYLIIVRKNSVFSVISAISEILTPLEGVFVSAVINVEG